LALRARGQDCDGTRTLTLLSGHVAPGGQGHLEADKSRDDTLVSQRMGQAPKAARRYSQSKEFLEAGKRRLTGDTARAATTDEVKALRQEARTLKEVVAEQALELRLLKKN
jgi:hypothetical protein